MIIQSAGVEKNGVVVNDEGQINAFSVIETQDKHVNHKTGKVWSLTLKNIDANAGTDCFYIKNTGSVDINITDFRLIANDAATVVWIKKVSGTVGGGTTVSDIQSRNLGVATVPVATVETASAATGLTGLTDEGTLFPMYLESGKLGHLSTSSNIIVAAGAALAIEIVTANATNGISGTISIVDAS